MAIFLKNDKYFNKYLVVIYDLFLAKSSIQGVVQLNLLTKSFVI